MWTRDEITHYDAKNFAGGRSWTLSLAHGVRIQLLECPGWKDPTARTAGFFMFTCPAAGFLNDAYGMRRLQAMTEADAKIEAVQVVQEHVTRLQQAIAEG